MGRLLLALLLIAGLPALQAQGPGTRTSGPCLATPTLDALSRALDDAVSGPGNKDRTCLRQILTPDARLSPVRKSNAGEFVPHALTVQDWIDAVAKRGDVAFYERQVKVTSEQYGHFAHLWSTYEIRETPDGKPTMTGINSIQAVFDGTRWRVYAILWEPDTTAGPIPKRYLP
jgi:hypothetical protein